MGCETFCLKRHLPSIGVSLPRGNAAAKANGNRVNHQVVWGGAMSKQRPVYFFGCDMGGWHNKDNDGGDALAVCQWTGDRLLNVEATAALTYYPVVEDGPLMKWLSRAINDNARVIVCIDAALAWPMQFRQLVNQASSGKHKFCFDLDGAINNPYLYREAERFIKQRVMTGNKEWLLTAVGDRFGNNSSKARHLLLGLFSSCQSAIGHHLISGIETLRPKRRTRFWKCIPRRV